MSKSIKKKFSPQQPIMVWDGDCDFCKKFAERFQEISKNTVEFIPNQELHKKYPGAPENDYQSSVYFLNKESSAKGAEAVFNFYYSRFNYFFLFTIIANSFAVRV